jgi:hypothetical protein
MGDALDDVWWRDEILQAMFWMRGEGLALELTAQELVSFLARPQEDISRHLSRLADAGDLVRATSGAYSLSPSVLPEAGRLFARDFEDMVNRSEHGSECSRPDCLCHTLGPEECLFPDERAAAG